MKTILTLSLLPVIVLAYFFSTRLYVNGSYLASYTLVAACFVSVVFWIRNVGLLLEERGA
jgi:hypothetical protein